MTDFGDELRRVLAERGISLSAAARQAGCSKGYLSNAANGRKPLTPRVAASLDRVFGTGDTFTAYALLPLSSRLRPGAVRAPGVAQGDAGTGPQPPHECQGRAGVVDRERETEKEEGAQDSDPGAALPGTPAAIGDLCAVLTDYGFSPRRFASMRSDQASDLERDLAAAFSAYQQSRFATAASRVSVLLADVELAMRECEDKDRVTLFKVLALSYQAAASVLTKAGESDVAWIAAERGLNAADATGNTAVRGSLIRSVAFVLMSAGRLEPAMRLVDSGADYLHAEVAGNDTVLSVYGTLLLVGAMAAARFGDGPRTGDYLREAHAAARRLGKDANHLWTAFGPTNVAIHRVNTAVELGDIQTVLDSGLSLETDAVPAERRVRYLLDVARVHTMTGNRRDALSAMLTAERIAPEQVRQHYLSRSVVTALVRGAPGKPSVQLDKLARRVRIREWV